MRKLVLVGSGEFTHSMDDTDRYLLSLLDEEHLPRSVVVLPTAAGQESDYAKWIKRGVSHFTQLKAKPSGIAVLSLADARNPEHVEQAGAASFVYFSGGDPRYLCDALQCGTLLHTPLWQAIYAGYQRGRVLAGCSAGAMIMGSHLLSNPEPVFESGERPTFEPGLGLVGYVIFPHYDAAQQEDPILFRRLLDSMLEVAPHRLLGIEENTALILFDEHQAQVMGKGQVHLTTGAAEEVFGPGATFTLPEGG